MLRGRAPEATTWLGVALLVAGVVWALHTPSAPLDTQTARL